MQNLEQEINKIVKRLQRAMKPKRSGMKFAAANPRPDSLGETNDCVVRALSLAFNRDYMEVHEVCAKVGRKPRRGMYRFQTDAAIQILTGDPGAYGTETRQYRRDPMPTFAQFARENPVGRFVVIKRGHAVALIDGVYHDMNNSAVCGARCRVQYYFRAA